MRALESAAVENTLLESHPIEARLTAEIADAAAVKNEIDVVIHACDLDNQNLP